MRKTYSNLDQIFTAKNQKSMTEIQKNELRIMLKGYENAQLTDKEYRILQGVLSSDFYALELKKYIEEGQTDKIDERKTPAEYHEEIRMQQLLKSLPQSVQINKIVKKDRPVSSVSSISEEKGNEIKPTTDFTSTIL